MNPILMIPQGVDFKNPANVSPGLAFFFNPIDDGQKLEDEVYFQWQEFVLLYGSLRVIIGMKKRSYYPWKQLSAPKWNLI